jgi:hypothetical protein
MLPVSTTPKITFAELRESNAYGILVYCNRCGHMKKLAAELFPDAARLSDLEPRLVCTACGHRGADVRPNFAPPAMGSRARG